MRVTGKCPPNSDELAAAAEMGFDSVELYLDESHLDGFENAVEACQTAPVDVTSVHTPHVPIEKDDYLQAANDLADEVGAEVLVFHSGKINLKDGVPAATERIDFTVEYAFENHNGYSPFHIGNAVFDRGEQLVLDTAHLYTAVGPDDYLETFGRLIDEHGDDIPLIHFCDSTVIQDGLQLGEGEVPLREAALILKNEYEGIVVLEVMPEEQQEALSTFNGY